MITDLESNYYLGTEKHFFDNSTSYPMSEAQTPALNCCGMPWDSYLTDDLLSDDFDSSRYKLLYFPNLFKPTGPILDKIRQLRAAGKSLLFAHAPGYLSDNGFSLEQMQTLTGLKLNRANDRCHTSTTPDGLSWDMPVSPRFCAQNATETLATFEDGSSALALNNRTDGQGFDAFCAGVPIPQELLRKLAVRAGCFQYIDTYDPVYACSTLMTVFCHEPGLRQLRWPHQASIREYFSGETYKIGPEGVCVPFAADETKIFLVDS